MKKNFLFCAIVLTLTGCGVKTAATDTVSTTPVSTAQVMLEKKQNEDALGKLQKISENSVSVKMSSKAELKEKYPDWFTKSGDIKYPVKPGDEKWSDTKSQKELYELSDIPKEIVDVLDTKTLLKAVEAHPLLSQPYDIWSVGMEAFSHRFYGLKTLLQREDSGIVAASFYLAKDMKKIVEKENSDEGNKQVMADEDYHKIILEEYLISTKKTYEQMDDNQRQQVLKAIKDNYEVEKEINKNAGFLQYHFYDIIAYGNNPWKK